MSITPTDQHVATLLKITALVNIGSALAALFLPHLNAELLYGTTESLEGLALRYHYLLWSTIFCMGVGYAIAARKPSEQTALITCGALGKICVAILWLQQFLAGDATSLILGAVSFDGILGVIFLIYVTPKVLDLK